MNMWKEYIWLVGVGILSGVVNVGFASYSETVVYTTLLLAGLPYGIISGLYFIRTIPRDEKYIRYFFWILASVLSYALAVQATILPADGGARARVIPSMELNFAIGGLVGALILSIAFHFLFNKMSLTYHLVLLGVGFFVTLGFFSILFNVFAVGLSEPNVLHMPWAYLHVYLLYILWQTTITAILGSSYLSRKSEVV